MSEDRRDALCMAVDCRASRILVSTRFKVGRDGQMACERFKREIHKGSRLGARGRNLVEEKTSRRLSGKLTCMWWEEDVCLGHQGNHRRSHCWRSKRRLAHDNSPKENCKRKVWAKQSADDRGISVAQE